ncbi:UNVERIFIED_CONTAM: hypothetical protein RMT77_002345 [Armadillidium vulgare]
MKRLRSAIGALTSLKSSSSEKETKEEGISDRFSNESSTRPKRNSFLLRSTISEDNDRTYVRYEETESLASITPSVVYEDPQNYCDPLSTKLHKWAFRGDVSKIKKNLKKNEVNAEDEKRRTPLHMGAYEGHVKVISLLLSSGANPESEDKDGRTPVLKAVEKGHVEAVQTFLKHKVNIHAKDYYGNSALHLACKSNSKNLVEILLECGIDLNQQNIRGRTPLYRAVEHQDINIVKCLVSYQADVNLSDRKGITPLMAAAKQGNQSLVEILINSGAELEKEDCDGWNAASYAKNCNFLNLYKWIVKFSSSDNLRRSVQTLNYEPTTSGINERKCLAENILEDSLKSWDDDDSSEENSKKNLKFNLSLFKSNHSDSSERGNASTENEVSPQSKNGDISKLPQPPFNDGNLSASVISQRIEKLAQGSSSLSDYVRNTRKAKNEFDDNAQDTQVVKTTSVTHSPDIKSDFSSERNNCSQDLTNTTFDDEDDNSDVFLPINDNNMAKCRNFSLKRQENVLRLEEDNDSLKDIALLENETIIEDYVSHVIDNSVKNINVNEDSKAIFSEPDSTKSHSLDSSEYSVSEKANEMLKYVSTNYSDVPCCISDEGKRGSKQILKDEKENTFNQNNHSVESNSNSLQKRKADTQLDNDKEREDNTFYHRRENNSCFIDSDITYSGHSRETLVESQSRSLGNISHLSNFSVNDPIGYIKNIFNSERISERKSSVISNYSFVDKKLLANTSTSNNEENVDYFKKVWEIDLNNFITNEKDSGFYEEMFTDDNLGYPLDIEQIQSLVTSLTIYLNRERSLKKFYKRKLHQVNEYLGILRYEVNYLKDENIKQIGDLQRLSLKTNETKYALTKSEYNVQFTLQKLEHVEKKFTLIEKNNQEQKLSMVNTEHLLSNFQNKELISRENFNFTQTKGNLIELQSKKRQNNHSENEKSKKFKENKTVFETSVISNIKNIPYNTNTIETVEKAIQTAETLTNFKNAFVSSNCLPLINSESIIDKAGRSLKKEPQLRSLITQSEPASLNKFFQGKISECDKNIEHNKNISESVKPQIAPSNLEITEGFSLPYLFLVNDKNIRKKLIPKLDCNIHSLDETTNRLCKYTDFFPFNQEEKKCKSLPFINTFENKVSQTYASYFSLHSRDSQTLDIYERKLENQYKKTLGCCVNGPLDDNCSNIGTQTYLEYGISNNISVNTQTDYNSSDKYTQTSTEHVIFSTVCVNMQTDYSYSDFSTQTSEEYKICINHCVSTQTDYISSDICTQTTVELEIPIQICSYTQTDYFSSIICRQTSDENEIPSNVICVTNECQTDHSSFCKSNKIFVDKHSQTIKSYFLKASEFFETNNAKNISTQTSIEYSSLNNFVSSLVSVNEIYTQTEFEHKDTEKENNLKDLTSVISIKTDNMSDKILEKFENLNKENKHYFESMFTLNNSVLKANDKNIQEGLKKLYSLQEIAAQIFEQIQHLVTNINADKSKDNTKFFFSIEDKLNNMDELFIQLQKLYNLSDAIFQNTLKTSEEVKNCSKPDCNLQLTSDKILNCVKENNNYHEENKVLLEEKFNNMEEKIMKIFLQHDSAENNYKNVENFIKILREDICFLRSRWRNNESEENMTSLKNSIETLLSTLTQNIKEILLSRNDKIESDLKSPLENLNIAFVEAFKPLQEIIRDSHIELLTIIKEISESIKCIAADTTDDHFSILSKQLNEIEYGISCEKPVIELASTTNKQIDNETLVETIKENNSKNFMDIKLQNESIINNLHENEKSLKEISVNEGIMRREIECLKEQVENKIILEINKYLKDKEEKYFCLKDGDEREKNFYHDLKTKIKCLEEDLNFVRKTNKDLTGENTSLKIQLGIKLEERKVEDETREKFYNSLQSSSHSQKQMDFTNELHNSTLISHLKSEIDSERQINKNLTEEKSKINAELQRQIEKNLEKNRNFRKELEEKKEIIKSLENLILEKELTEEISSSKENRCIHEYENRNKKRIIRELKEKISDLELECKELNNEVSLKTNIIIQLKNKIVTLNNNIRKLTMKNYENPYEKFESENLLMRIQELEKESNNKQSLILNLREKLDAIEKEKKQLISDIDYFKEKSLSTDLIVKGKNEAEEELKKALSDLQSTKQRIERDFVLKSKLSYFYQEIESYFDGLLTCAKEEGNSVYTNKVNIFEHQNILFQEQEKRLQREIYDRDEQIKKLINKLSFAHYNIHIWELKYQNLFDQHYKIPISTESKNSSYENNFKTKKELSKEDANFYDMIYRDIEKYLERPLMQSEFLDLSKSCTSPNISISPL